MLTPILVILITAFYQLFPPIYAQETAPLSQTLQLEEYSCNASDPASLKACIEEARKTGVPVIKISKPIICTSSSDCNFEIKDLQSSLTITPINPQNKIIRQADFSYTLLNIENSSNIVLAGLSFEDQTQTNCPLSTLCPPFITIKNSSAVTFDQVSFNKTIGTSVNILDSKKISILNSSFKNSFKTALEIKTTQDGESFKIKDNTFENNSGTALIFQVSNTTSQSIIEDNNFTNNHAGGAYTECTYPCTGAQIKIIGPTSKLSITQNKITGGDNSAFDNLGLYASGIELSGPDIKETSLTCNYISGNRASGIVQSPPFKNISELEISENKIYNNGLNLNTPSVLADEDNCYTQKCQQACLQ